MTFNEYQEQALSTAIYPDQYRIFYPSLGLVGESGEVAEKVKKVLRDKGGLFDELTKAEIVKEISDVLWYLAALASDLGVSLDHVAEVNISKLLSRKERNVLQGSGDNR